MSAAMNTAIFAQLTGNAPLVEMLGHDPVTGGPTIYHDHRNEKSPQDLYPAIIFRCCTRSPRPGMDIASGVYGIIEDEFYDFTIEHSSLITRRANAVDDIFDVMDPLLHQQQLSVPDPTKSFNYKCLRIAGASPSIYDAALKVYRCMARYRMTMAHA